MKCDSLVLVINCGSSSVKFSVLDSKTCEVVISGMADGIETEHPQLKIDKNPATPLPENNHSCALAAIAEELKLRGLLDAITLVGHRIAHGGNEFSEAAIIDERVLAKIRQVSPLAPLHNHANLSGVMAARQLFPTQPQIAVFDTGFHQTLKPEAYIYGLPYQYLQDYGVRRYGFHGTSHRYVAEQAVSFLGLNGKDVGLVIAHLGNGASICAVQDGKSVDTSMGMTPLEGLIMGSRSGDIDFGALAYIASKTGQSIEDIERILNKHSGLLGISGLSSDMRVLEAAYHEGHPGAKLAIHAFVHRIARHIGGHATSLRRLDAVIFTGGIGENSTFIRRLVCERLQVFGIAMSEALNKQPNAMGCRIISAPASAIFAAVIPTNEEKMIALDAIRLGQEIRQAECV
ncbi:propionate kinase [Aeromonas allosaccharophila]|uniref:Acetate kinase n=1 Tax=Aeromonas allosaccharophila TaxID=656 RepID=A0A7T2PIX4_9GAMM|nr:propionate kinase [Aeromonas allosaccharophila]QPR56643.1 propionate kinase [Aeromonas allosaccharophila]